MDFETFTDMDAQVLEHMKSLKMRTIPIIHQKTLNSAKSNPFLPKVWIIASLSVSLGGNAYVGVLPIWNASTSKGMKHPKIHTIDMDPFLSKA